MLLELDRVKNYLRVYADQTFDDLEITSMVDGAFEYFSKETNHIFAKVEKEYHHPFRIYDFPVYDPDSKLVKKPNYYIPRYCPGEEIKIEVGYESIDDVPQDIIQCILQIVKVWYYESEKEQNSTLLPISTKQVIEKYRRFYI